MEKRVDMWLKEIVTVAPGNATQEAAAATSRQEGLLVMIEDSVASAPEAAAGAKPANVRSVQITGDVESQRSTRGVDARQEEDEVVAEVGLV